MNEEIPFNDKYNKKTAISIIIIVYGIFILLSQLFLAFNGSELFHNPWKWIFLSAICFTWIFKLDVINIILISIGVYLGVVYKFNMDWWVGILCVCPFVNYISIPIILYILFF